MPGHGPLSQDAGPFGGLESGKRDLFPSSTRRSAAPPNGTEGCATEVAQTKEDRGRRRKRGGERSRKRERKREYGEKNQNKNVIQRARIDWCWFTQWFKLLRPSSKGTEILFFQNNKSNHHHSPSNWVQECTIKGRDKFLSNILLITLIAACLPSNFLRCTFSHESLFESEH